MTSDEQRAAIRRLETERDRLCKAISDFEARIAERQIDVDRQIQRMNTFPGDGASGGFFPDEYWATEDMALLQKNLNARVGERDAVDAELEQIRSTVVDR